MTDDDIILEDIIRNAPEPPAASPRTDYRELRQENARRHAASLDALRCYLNGRPHRVYIGKGGWRRSVAC